MNVCALRFLYIKVLKRRDMKEDLPYPNERKHLPVILSPAEVARLIAGARNLYHRAMLMMLYATGLRRAEMCRLKVSDIDSKRMMLRVVQGKGGIDRDVPLSKTLLRTPRVLPLDEAASLLIPRDCERLARRYFGNENPVGRRITFADENRDLEILGVSANLRHGDLKEGSPMTVFVAASQFSQTE